MNFTSIENSAIYIHELQDPFQKIEFQFMPDGISWERIGNYARYPIVGRNNSRKQLTGGEDKITFTLDFNGLFETDKRHCIQQLQFLQSLAATDGFAGPGRNVKIAWGDMFRFKVWVVTRVGGRLSDFSSKFNFNPLQLMVDLELELDPAENRRMLDVRGIFVNTDVPLRSINDSTATNNNIA